MDYTLYSSSDMNRKNVVYIKDINLNSQEHNLQEERLYNISKTKFSLVVLNNIDNTGRFGIYSCKFSSSLVTTEGLTTGLFFGSIEHSISPNIQVKNLHIVNFNKHSLNISNTEDTIIDFPTKEGFKSTIIIFNKQYFINQNEVYDIQRPLLVRSLSGYHTLYFKLILVELGCKNSYIINGNGTSYFVNLQQTEGLICMHFVSYSDSRITVFNPKDVEFIKYGNNYMIENSNSIERGVTLRINNTQRINSLAGVASIEAKEINPEEFSKGIFNKQYDILIFPKTTIYESKEGLNQIDIQKDELVILSSDCEYNQNMIINFKSTNSLKEININLEQKIRNKKFVYIQTTAEKCIISYYYSKFNNDCYAFNMVIDKINQQYFIIAEPYKRYCITMISTNETDMIFYSEDQFTKINSIREYEKQKFKYIEFISNNETYIMIKETSIIGNEYISNSDNIYSEGKQLHEISDKYYIAQPGFNIISLNKAKIIYPKVNGFRDFVAFDNPSNIYFSKSQERGIISELDETLDVETQESSIKFYLLILPEGDYSYDFCFKPIYNQVYWNTSNIESNKKHILVLFGDLDYNNKKVIRTPEFPNDETFNVYESYVFGFNKAVITDTLKTFRTNRLIVEYISSSTKREGIVGIYDIGFISSNYRSYDTILSLEKTHQFDGFIDPVKVSTLSEFIYGPNLYRESKFKTLVITYEHDDNFNHLLYFNDEKSLMKCDHSPISKLIYFHKTFVIKSSFDYYNDVIYHLKVDKDCDTVDFLFNQYGNHFTVDPLHFNPNKKHCIATLTKEKTTITLMKHDYSDSSYSMFFSESFNMDESFEISETNHKNKFYSMIKIIIKGDCNFPYCGVIFDEKSSSLEPKIYHVDGFNHLFEEKSLVRQLLVSQLGYNSFNLQNYEATTIRVAKSDKFNTFVIFHSIQYINESSRKIISTSVMNPDIISVFTNNYNIEFTVYHLAKDCIIKYNVNYFNDLYITNTDTKENSKYCIIHLGTSEMTTVFFKDTKTSNSNSFSYYDSFSMDSTPIIIEDGFTSLKARKSLIIEYRTGEGNPYGHVGILHTTPRYIFDKFEYPGKVIETGTNQNTNSDNSNDRLLFISAKFGRNTVKVSKHDVTTVITPISFGKNVLVAFLNINEFVFPGMSDIKEIIISPGSFKIRSKQESGILEFVVFALENEESTLDFIINQDTKQYLIDVGYKYFISSHLIVFIGSENYSITSFISSPIANNENFQIEIYMSYTMNDEPEVIRESKSLHNIQFAVFRIISNDVYKNSLIGISSISTQRQISQSHISGNFYISTYPHIFKNATSLSLNVSLRPEILNPRVSIVSEMSTVKIGPNTLITFDSAISKDYFITAASNGIKINLTEKKAQAIITKKETEISVEIIKNDSISRIPMNIFKLDYLQDKCNGMVISGGSEDITFCSKSTSQSMKCTDVISKENKTCIFKSFSSKYSKSDIKSNKINFVEIFTPDGTPIKRSMEDSNLSINSYFVSVINPPEDIDQQDFFFSANMKNQNNEIESPYRIENDEIYEFDGKSNSGAIAGGTLFSIFIIFVIVTIVVIYIQKKRDQVESDDYSNDISDASVL
ncbi:hypothetical protein TVAG_467900 [Trichomonas vaginalis G3]|uniref:Uncharacterized protein n=1 Tax=Trichomonas vaginalis (strain ATCC PRA-98 / G3) TaxID=412133 RepID=A2E0N0_TRIV3|nr:hypothetical protein TVAGG3_0073930 [Trichomonas vaginalis G3]EAY13775.1 hypothetical protein TVAG_467900 [Trichomonas vaginalis G3]KAI5542708.1 hypothetical protein TVAGG3_0073930 [Trichomonas vaginalis G3]|eukprot:XP_001325998.1 hypothetical protein [Trichomonas vaginalis G3]